VRIPVRNVGLVSAVAFAHWGHEVVGLDHEPPEVVLLRDGESWFHEPGLAVGVRYHGIGRTRTATSGRGAGA
jgi:UDP-glucose 6-dehydrogenase